MEFEASKAIAKVVLLFPLALGSARVHFQTWHHRFDLASNAAVSFVPLRERGFPVTACFPSLCRKYLPLLPWMGRALGTFLESSPSAASVVAKAAGLPSVRVIISDSARLPSEISLSTLAGDWISQCVEFSGLPNQCFACRKIGHLAQACTSRPPRSRQRRPTSTQAHGPPDAPPHPQPAGAAQVP